MRGTGRAPAMRAELAIAWLTGSLPRSIVMLGIGRLHEDIAQHMSNPVNEGVDVHAYAQKLRVNMEAYARCHRKSSRRPAREENPDGLGWETPLPQSGVAANSCYMIISIVRVRPPAAGRRNEAFGDHVPDLTLRRPGAQREITNVHDQPISTKFLSNHCGRTMASIGDAVLWRGLGTARLRALDRDPSATGGRNLAGLRAVKPQLVGLPPRRLKAARSHARPPGVFQAPAGVETAWGARCHPDQGARSGLPDQAQIRARSGP